MTWTGWKGCPGRQLAGFIVVSGEGLCGGVERWSATAGGGAGTRVAVPIRVGKDVIKW